MNIRRDARWSPRTALWKTAGKLLGDSAAVTTMLDRLLHYGHILKCGSRSWRTKTDLPDQEKMG